MIELKYLFNKDYLVESEMDYELLVSFEIAYRALERVFEKRGLEMPYEFEAFREKMHILWEEKQRIPTNKIVYRVQKGDKWLKDNLYNFNKQWVDAMMLYQSLIQELKYRGITEEEALKTKLEKVTEKKLLEIFGDMLIPIRGGEF